MNFLNKLFKRKEMDGIQTGGFELLRRFTSGTWSQGKALSQYEKSLYVMACVSKIAQKVASTEFELYQFKNSKGDVKEIYNHPLLDLIYKPNPFQTKTEFLQKTIINKKLAGDAFWYKVRNNGGNVVELWNLRPDYMTIIKDPELYIKGYEFTKVDGTKEFFAQEDIIHFKGVNPLDEFYGSSPIRSAQTRVDTEAFASAYQRDFFLNNARPDAVLKTSGQLTDEQRADIKASFEKRHQGVGKSSKVALFEGGIDYQQISISQREMDFIESMKFTRDDILVAFAVPKPIVAITDDVNRANAETAMYIFLSETINPEIRELFEKINEEMTYPDFGDNLFLDYENPTPENREQTLKEYENGLTHGWLLINEVRQRENYEPIEGGWALYKPFGMEAVGGATAQKGLKNIGANGINNKKRFRGRKNLLVKMIIAEELKKGLENLKKKEIKPLIKGENRAKYYDLINKRIDKRHANLKKEIIKLNKKQGEELLKLLDGVDLTKGIKETKDIKAVGKKAKKIIDKFYLEQPPVYAKFIFPFLEEFAKSSGKEALAIIEPGKDFIFTDAMKKALKERAVLFGLEVNKTTRDQITEVIANGIEAGMGMTEISDNISGVYSDFGTARADKISRTETTAGNNKGTLEGFKQSIATHKEWIATPDDRTRESHADIDGETVKKDARFSNGLQYPGEESGDPGETINCRCVMAPALEK